MSGIRNLVDGGIWGGAAPALFPLRAPDGSASAPSYSWVNSTNSGLYRVSNAYAWVINGVERAGWVSNSWKMSSTLTLEWNSAAAVTSGTSDLILLRDAANTLAQRNGTTAQAHRIYNTFTDASNYERGAIAWETNVLTFSSRAAGTGTARAIIIEGPQISFAPLSGSNANVWRMLTTGHLIAVTDNTYDIGAVAATRPRSIYAATSITTAGTTVGALGAATAVGQRRFVTDALGPVFGAVVAGGGAVPVPVYADGANWIVG